MHDARTAYIRGDTLFLQRVTQTVCARCMVSMVTMPAACPCSLNSAIQTVYMSRLAMVQ